MTVTDYTTRTLLKARMDITNSNSDAMLDVAVTSASRAIDDHCNRSFFQTVDTRIFEPCDPYNCDVDDLVTLTTLKVDFSGLGVYSAAWIAGQYQLRPVNPTRYAEPKPYESIRALGGKWFPPKLPFGIAETVQVAGTFGWPAVPANVSEAALILAEDGYKLREAAFGVAGFGEFGPLRVRDNPRATELLRTYRRNPGSLLAAA